MNKLFFSQIERRPKQASFAKKLYKNALFKNLIVIKSRYSRYNNTNSAKHMELLRKRCRNNMPKFSWGINEHFGQNNDQLSKHCAGWRRRKNNGWNFVRFLHPVLLDVYSTQHLYVISYCVVCLSWDGKSVSKSTLEGISVSKSTLEVSQRWKEYR